MSAYRIVEAGAVLCRDRTVVVLGLSARDVLLGLVVTLHLSSSLLSPSVFVACLGRRSLAWIVEGKHVPPRLVARFRVSFGFSSTFNVLQSQEWRQCALLMRVVLVCCVADGCG